MKPRASKAKPASTQSFVASAPPALGVDLVELKRAKSLYATYRNDLSFLFSRQEVTFIRRGKRPYENMAVLLAAKEAIFKALDAPWMGIAGFRNIRIVPTKRRTLSYRLFGSFRRPGRKGRPLELSFFKNKSYVVVRCVGNS